MYVKTSINNKLKFFPADRLHTPWNPKYDQGISNQVTRRILLIGSNKNDYKQVIDCFNAKSKMENLVKCLYRRHTFEFTDNNFSYVTILS